MEREEKKNLVKAVGGIIAGFGTSCVVTNAIKFTTPLNLSPMTKVGVLIGSTVLSGIFSNMAGKYVDETVDQVDELIDSINSYNVDVKISQKESAI